MTPEIALGRCVIGLRLAGRDFDDIALTLADGVVDALIAGGYRDAALDRALRAVVETMWDRTVQIHTPQWVDGPFADPPVAPRLTLVTGGGEP